MEKLDKNKANENISNLIKEEEIHYNLVDSFKWLVENMPVEGGAEKHFELFFIYTLARIADNLSEININLELTREKN